MIPTDTLAIARAVGARECSAREAALASFARIDATDGRINAYTLRTFERALREADALDAQLARGAPMPPLAGVPYSVKNLFDIAGETTLAGSRIHRTHAAASADAFLVSRMQAAGAVLTGALNMDEYAYGFTTENSHYGACHNPHDLNRSAGGSSGGSGAAVAAGQVGVTLGSDTNGSIRVPASFCGVWGLKPTFGRLSRRGSFPFVHSIDHLGPLADSVGALARVYDALQGADPLDPGCHATRTQPVSGVIGRGSADLRIGVLGGYFHDHAGTAARNAAQLAAMVLRARDQVTWPDAQEARAAAFITTASEGGTLHLDDLRTRMEEFEPLSVERFLAGVLQPASWLVRAQRFRRAYRDKVNALFSRWDVLIAPATPVPATPLGAETIEIDGRSFPCRPSIGLLTQPISFAGCPVVAAPTWPEASGGLPLGVQLIAAPWREDLALRAAHTLEEAGVAHLREAAL